MLWDTIRRWRTWIVNTLAAALIAVPDIMSAFAGVNWNGLLPDDWMPYATLALVVLNIWMRPRAAVLPEETRE